MNLLYYQNEYEKNPKSDFYIPLANEYRKMGQYEEAIHTIKKAEENRVDAPKKRQAQYVLAYCFSDMKRWEAAYEILSQWIYSDLENIKMLKLYFTICEKTNRI